MSQTKECMEYMLVLLDEMYAEAKKIIHRDKYKNYDRKVPDFEFIEHVYGTLGDIIEEAQVLFERCIPAEIRARNILELENEVLKKNLEDFREKLKDRNDI